MKKVFLVGALALFGVVNAQKTGSTGFKAGVHLGVPIGDFSESHSFNFGVDVAYLYPIAKDFRLGVTSGYSHYTGKTKETTIPYLGTFKVTFKDVGINPLAASGQYNFSNNILLGLDLGYAFFTGEGTNTGGFYYQPKVGYAVSGRHDLYFSYKGISNNGNVGSLNVGYAYNF